MRVVLDTNVLVSALLNPERAPAAIANAALDGTLTILVDNRILFEYEDVLHRENFGFKPQDVRAFLDFFRHEGEYVSATATNITLDDPDDLPFFEVAKTANADYLITGNTKHFPDEDWVVSPRNFLKTLVARD